MEISSATGYVLRQYAPIDVDWHQGVNWDQ